MEGIDAEFDSISRSWEDVEGITLEKLDEIIELLNQAIDGKKQLLALVPGKATATLDKWKDLHVSVSKFAKTLDKKLRPEQGAIDLNVSVRDDLEKDKKAADIESQRDEILFECLLHHFYGEGLFELGDCLVEESKMADKEAKKALKEPYIKLVELLGSLRAGDVGPSMVWAKGLGDERLQFELAKLHYVGLLLGSRPNDALQFAQNAFPPFTKSFSGEIETLMGCLAFSNRLSASPYKNYLAIDEFMGSAIKSLSVAYCKAMRVPQESVFSQCIRLGVQSLPKINRVMALMKERKGIEWSQQDELPVEIDLPPTLRHHSIFVCPVLRQQATKDNPPMMLPCGHVICKEALTRLSKQSSQTRFKCPYCPAETNSLNAQQVYF